MAEVQHHGRALGGVQRGHGAVQFHTGPAGRRRGPIILGGRRVEQRAALRAAVAVQKRPPANPRQPRRIGTRAAEITGAVPGAQKHVLGQIIGIGGVARKAAKESPQAPFMPQHQQGEGRTVARRRARMETLVFIRAQRPAPPAARA